MLQITDEGVNRLFYDLLTVFKRKFVMIRGAAGSGKSYAMAQYLIIRCLQNKEKFLVVRAVASTLKDSCVSLIKEILDEWNIMHKYNKVDKHFSFPNGSEILLKGLDDESKLLSINGISNIWVEEAVQITSRQLDQLNFRLRGEVAKDAQIFLTFNPISNQHWIKKDYYDNIRNDVDFHFSTYKDNKFIGDGYAEKIQIYQKTNPLYYQVYVLGNWGVIQTGQEFYNCFDSRKHVTEKTQYDPFGNLYISLDMNVNPYSALLISTISESSIDFIDEISLRGKNIREVCLEFCNRYKNHKGKVVVTGDATAQAQDTRLERGQTFYTLVQDYLKQFNLILNIPKSNESVTMRGVWLNEILYTDTIKIRMNKKCEQLITDMSYLQMDKDGKKFKQIGKMEGSDTRCELYGHQSDCFDYQITNNFRHEYRLWLSGGVKNPFLGTGTNKNTHLY